MKKLRHRRLVAEGDVGQFANVKDRVGVAADDALARLRRGRAHREAQVMKRAQSLPAQLRVKVRSIKRHGFTGEAREVEQCLGNPPPGNGRVTRVRLGIGWQEERHNKQNTTQRERERC